MQVRNVVEVEMRQLAKTDSYSTEPITITIRGKLYPTLELVDLPGLRQIPASHREKTQNIIRYISVCSNPYDMKRRYINIIAFLSGLPSRA